MEFYKGLKPVLKSGIKVISTKFDFNNGCSSMPIVGCGTYQVKSEQIYDTLDAAFACGYRHIDTATVYHNEVAIGEALKKLLPKYGLRREDIYITTKLAPTDMEKSLIEDAVYRSLHNLGIDYIDVYLIHWPGAQGIAANNSENPRFRVEAWRELVRLHEEGLGVIRAIGVSNFTARHLEQIIALTRIPPVVNQVEFHPYYPQPKELYAICAKYNILLQAYASLGGSGNNKLLDNAVVKQCANKQSVSPAQLLLRWALQNGYAIIPKSVTPEKIKMNSELDFELDADTMENISSIYKKEFCYKFAWDPRAVL